MCGSRRRFRELKDLRKQLKGSSPIHQGGGRILAGGVAIELTPGMAAELSTLIIVALKQTCLMTTEHSK